MVIGPAALLVGLASSQAQPGAYEGFLTLYDALLAAHVGPATLNGITYNGVDYGAWRDDPRHAEARDLLLATKPSPVDHPTGRLAYWINVYNFLTVDLIVRENEQQSIKNLGGFFRTPWQVHSWPIAGRDYTLDDIEHRIIRPMGDARIHFAINCAAISCPDLRTEAYRADRLDLQLDQQVAATLADTAKGFRAGDTGQTVYVSKIMDWFREDFSASDLQSWLRSEGGKNLPADADVRFLQYDWTLNGR
jgi:hypothetical protein